MSTQAARPVREILASLTPNWLWTWDGVCFGYRRGNSLFTYDGIEVGRFSGVEVYGADSSIKTTEKHYAPFVASMQRMLDEAVATLDSSHRHRARSLPVKPPILGCGN
jgi:hypothetical protein